ncbi:MAG TPA: ATP-binding protein [Patescibacteria group bacterium]|nr:ATP-binding protein [Patescibacteria group bacterium]
MKLFHLLKRKKAKDDGGYSYHLIENGSIVLCVMHGYITHVIVKQLLADGKIRTGKLAKQGRKTLLLTDVSNVTGVSADARKVLRVATDYVVDKSAVFGANPFITLIAQYVIRLSPVVNKTMIFKTRSEAVNWVLGRKKRHNNAILIVRTYAFLVGLLGTLVLFGWYSSNSHLKTLGLVDDPRNPVVALNMILIASALIFLTLNAKNKLRFRWPIGLIGAWLIVFGSLVVVGALSGIKIPIDSWLFSSQLAAEGNLRCPTSVAIIFIFIGMLIPMTLIRFSRSSLSSRLFRSALIVAVVATIGVLISNVLGTPTPRELGTMVVFFGIELSLMGIASRTTGQFPILVRIFMNYWQGIIVFAVTMTVSIFIWQNSKNAERATELNSLASVMSTELQANLDVLRDYKAFLQSSNSVQAMGFENYFINSGLQNRYPALSSIAFLRNTSLVNQSYQIAFVVPVSLQIPSGVDYAKYPQALKLLDKARYSAMPEGVSASGIPSFTKNINSNQGMFLAIAVYSHPVIGAHSPSTFKPADLNGFIVAQFSYQQFFQNFITNNPSSGHISMFVHDDSSKNIIFKSIPSETNNDSKVAFSRDITFAGHKLTLSILQRSPIPSDTLTSSNSVLLAGAIASLLTAVTVVLLAHRRREALKLAELITEDLEKERSKAVLVAQKDEAILTSIGEALVVTDNDGKIVLTNNGFFEMFGYKEEEVYGKPLAKAIVMVDSYKRAIPFSHRKITKVLNSNKMLRIEMSESLMYVRKNGTTFIAGGTITPISVDGKVTGAVEIVHDLTLEASIDKAKTEFVSLASHQLRTPLTAAKWNSEMLLDGGAGKLDPKQKIYISGAYEAIVRTIKLVSSLLNISRLESGSIAIDPKDMDIIPIIHAQLNELSEQINEKDLDVRIVCPEKLVMYNDSRLFRIVIENLMTNAIKYTPPKGLIGVTVTKDRTSATIKVSDSGYGIPQNQQGRIFTKLFRADNVRAKTAEGFGLGLYLVKAIVKCCGGEVWFESVENKGTTFYLKLPISGVMSRSGKQIIE